MKKVQMIKGRLVGQHFREAGSTVELEDFQAEQLVSAGVASYQIAPAVETATLAKRAAETATMKRRRKDA